METFIFYLFFPHFGSECILFWVTIFYISASNDQNVTTLTFIFWLNVPSTIRDAYIVFIFFVSFALHVRVNGRFPGGGAMLIAHIVRMLSRSLCVFVCASVRRTKRRRWLIGVMGFNQHIRTEQCSSRGRMDFGAAVRALHTPSSRIAFALSTVNNIFIFIRDARMKYFLHVARAVQYYPLCRRSTCRKHSLSGL